MSEVINSWTQLADPSPDDGPGRRVPAVSPLTDGWHRFLCNRMAVAGGVVVLVMALGAISAPLISAYVVRQGPNDQDLVLGPQPPLTRSFSGGVGAGDGERAHLHLFGTDILGRDLFVRVLYGARISLFVGLLATLLSVIVGVTYGAVSGYYGGWIDGLMMRIVDILFSLPYLFFVIMLMVMLGHRTWVLFLALGAVQWLMMSRVVRGQIMVLKKRQFVEAARSTGVRETTIIFRHLVPNTVGPIVVYATLTMPVVMLAEAFLSFLGLGIQPPDASWGSLAAEGAATMDLFPWLIVFPGLTLAVTLLSLNFLGDGLRDAFDPQTAEEGP